MGCTTKKLLKDVPVLIPKQFLDFEKIQNKSKKAPFYTKQLEKSKKRLYKSRKCGLIYFFLFFDPPNVPVLIPKQFSDFDEILNKYKKTPATPKIGKIQKKCIFKGR